MKKQILLWALLFSSVVGFSQTYEAKPVDAVPYGTQLYKRPNNDIIAGLGSAKFRVLDTKQRVDSLAALRFKKQGDSISGVLTITTPTYTGSPSSPYLGGLITQGYAYDGVNHYVSGDSLIRKYNASWALISEKTNLNSTLGNGANHIGDFDFNSTRDTIFAPIDHWVNCGSVTNNRIAVLDKNLNLITSYDIAAALGGVGAGSLTVFGDKLVIGSFCDGTKLPVFTKQGVALPSIALSTPINGIQGIKYYNGLFYIVNETKIFTCKTDGSNVIQIADIQVGSFNSHIAEGIELVNGVINVLLNKNDGVVDNIYAFTPNPNVVSPIVQLGSSGLNFLKTVNVGGSSYSDAKVIVNNTSSIKLDMGILNGITRGYVGKDDGGTSITENSFWNTAASAWQRNNPLKPSFAFIMSQNGQNFQFRYAPAASGTVNWITPLTIGLDGVSTFNGNIVPSGDVTKQLGYADKRFATIYGVNTFLNLITTDRVNLGGATTVVGTPFNALAKSINPLMSLKNNGVGGKPFYVFVTIDSNSIGGGKFLINPKSGTGIDSKTFSIDTVGRVGIAGVQSLPALINFPTSSVSAGAMYWPSSPDYSGTQDGMMWNNNGRISVRTTSGIKRVAYTTDSDSLTNSFTNGIGVGILPATNTGVNLAYGTGISMLYGGDFNSNTLRTTSVNKAGRIFGLPYNTSQTPVITMTYLNDASANTLNIGGGSGIGTAITSLKVYAAASLGVATGTNVANFTTSGLDLKVGKMISPQYTLSALNTAPASATATGTLGEIRVTSTFIYICTATNTWVRAALATW